MRRLSFRWWRFLLFGGIVSGSICSVRLQAQVDTSVRVTAMGSHIAWAHVTYISGQSIYIDAGTLAGLKEGSRLEVRRDTVWIANLVVAFVSSRRASCAVSRSSSSVVVGDSAQYEAIEAPRIAAGDSAAHADRGSNARTRGAFDHPLRGRLGIRYLALDPGSGAARLSQPAFDLRLDGERLGDLPLGLAVDVRARRNLRAGVSSTSPGIPGNDTRVYQAVLQLHGGSAARLSVGRQFSTAMSTVGLFDGAAADFDWRHVGAGAFAGTQPDPFTLGLSSDIREAGVYTQFHNAPNGSGIWSFTTGAIGSYAGREINREFLYLRGLLVTRRLSVYAAQEMDYNRGWKLDAGERTTSSTSTFANVRLALTDALSITGGVDNRRQVRLYRDWISPETEFDDSFREGILERGFGDDQARGTWCGYPIEQWWCCRARHFLYSLGWSASSYTSSSGTPLAPDVVLRGRRARRLAVGGD
jgi:hypothetical protein